MTMIGADVEALRALATDFTHGAAELQQLSAELARAVDDAEEWQGADATRVKAQLGELTRTRMSGVAAALEHAGTLLADQATEQEVGSAAVSTAAAHPSLLSRLVAWGKAAWGAKGVVGKVAGLVSFFKALGKESFFGRTRDSIKALEKVRGLQRGPTWVMKRLDMLGLTRLSGWAGKIGKVAGRLALPITVVSALHDLRTGGGYTGWRATATKVAAAAGAAGGIVLLAGAAVGAVAAAPVVAVGLGIAGAGVTAYTAWSLGNAAYDDIGWVKEQVDGLGARVSTGWSSAWQGARSTLEISRTYARGLLGPAPVAAGAGS